MPAVSRSDETDSAFAGEPAWDDDRARSLIGKFVPIGVGRYEADGGALVDQQQIHGVHQATDPVAGITVALRGDKDGETTILPPFLPAFEDEPPVEYRLRETGEVIVDPDLTTAWKLVRPKKSRALGTQEQCTT